MEIAIAAVAAIVVMFLVGAAALGIGLASGLQSVGAFTWLSFATGFWLTGFWPEMPMLIGMGLLIAAVIMDIAFYMWDKPTTRDTALKMFADRRKGRARRKYVGIGRPVTEIKQERGAGMKIYLAAKYSRREELLLYRASLEARGYQVTSRWLNGLEQYGLSNTEDDRIDGGMRQAFAIDDTYDLLKADMIIAFTEKPESAGRRGGRHVELGMALARGYPVIIVGPAENVFCELDGILRVDDWPSVTDWLIGQAEPVLTDEKGFTYEQSWAAAKRILRRDAERKEQERERAWQESQRPG